MVGLNAVDYAIQVWCGGSDTPFTSAIASAAAGWAELTVGLVGRSVGHRSVSMKKTAEDEPPAEPVDPPAYTLLIELVLKILRLILGQDPPQDKE